MGKDNLSVMMLGAGEVYHSEPVAYCIKKVKPTARIVSHGLFKVGEKGGRVYLRESSVFDKVYQLKHQRDEESVTQKVELGSRRASLITGRSYWVKGVHHCYHSVKAWFSAVQYKKEFVPLIDGVDVLHLHSLFVNPGFLWLLTLPNKPLVVSCWGSDVLRTSDVHVTQMQKTILEHASVITVSNLEFKEIILSKYGRHLEEKVVYAQFNPKIEGLLKKGKKANQKQCVEDKQHLVNVCVGHNGTVQCNHRELLQSIASLPHSLKHRLKILLPMTYGAPFGYVEEIRKLASTVGCEFTILDQYMSDEEVEDMYVEMDVLLYAPVSDAFSASVTKALASGVRVIAGAWLPYKSRVLSGFKYHEISHLSEAGKVLQEILEEPNRGADWGEDNRALAAKIFSEKAIGQGWLDAYEKAIETFKKNA